MTGIECDGRSFGGNNEESCRWLRELHDETVFIVTFGCTYNHGDTRKLIEILRWQGCTITGSAQDADIVVVNTCSVIESTTRKVLRAIRSYRHKRLYITGCMPQVEPERIFEICDPHIIPPGCIQEIYRENPVVPFQPVGIVQIAKGCPGGCTYCITRFARGPLESFPRDEILHQVREYVRMGATEIQLTAQDVSAWGTDTGESLTELLREVLKINGSFRIRLGMMNPASIKLHTPKILGVFESEKIFRFIHLPIQSGSDGVLARMGRNYSANDCINLVTEFRGIIPDVSIMTDIIVGFPGESVQDFQESVHLIKLIRPEKVNITRFSRRRGTGIYNAHDFTDYVKKTRSREMNRIAEKIYHENNALWLGKVVPVIVTERVKQGSVISRTPSYQNVVIREELPVGTTGEALLVEERMYYFIGSMVRKR